MSKTFAVNPKTDIVIDRFIDAPPRLVWEALTKPEHVMEWWMPKPWGRVARVEMDLRPGGNFRLDLAVGGGPDIPNMGCILEVVPMERFVFTSMLFADYRPAVFDDIPITAIISMKGEGAGTRYVFTALHRDESDMEKNKEQGWLEGTQVAIDQLVELINGMKKSLMARLVFGMNQSLDGYVDHMAFAPSVKLFRHFIEEAERTTGAVYGRKMYEIMGYWDTDHPEWGAAERDFATAWRRQHKWVVSRTLKSVGANATLVGADLEGAMRLLKAERDGEIEVAGPDLASTLTALGLIDEYRIYLHPVVLGKGTPYFAGPRPPLRLLSTDRIGGEDVLRLTYAQAT